MEHQELLDLAKQLVKVRNAKKAYYFFFVLEGSDSRPVLFVERQPGDARRKGMAAKSQARKKQVAHGRVELRSRRAVFINETALSSRKIKKAFKYALSKEPELRGVAPVLRKSDIISVEEDLVLTMEAAPVTDVKIKKVTSPKSKGKGKSRSSKKETAEIEEPRKQEARWEKLLALSTRRIRILERKTERLRPVETVPIGVVQDLKERVRQLREQMENAEKEYQTGQPKLAIRALVTVHEKAKELKEQLDDLPSEASSDSMDMELGWVKVLHQSWSCMVETHLVDRARPVADLCAPLTQTLDRLLMSETIEELHTRREQAIAASKQVTKALNSSPLLKDLVAHPNHPLDGRDGLFPTLDRVTASLRVEDHSV